MDTEYAADIASESMSEGVEGYFWPAEARKVHYMVDGRSLCGKWMILHGHSGLSNTDGGHAMCAGCERKRVARAS